MEEVSDRGTTGVVLGLAVGCLGRVGYRRDWGLCLVRGLQFLPLDVGVLVRHPVLVGTGLRLRAFAAAGLLGVVRRILLARVIPVLLSLVFRLFVGAEEAVQPVVASGYVGVGCGQGEQLDRVGEVLVGQALEFDGQSGAGQDDGLVRSRAVQGPAVPRGQVGVLAGRDDRAGDPRLVRDQVEQRLGLGPFGELGGEEDVGCPGAAGVFVETGGMEGGCAECGKGAALVGGVAGQFGDRCGEGVGAGDAFGCRVVEPGCGVGERGELQVAGQGGAGEFDSDGGASPRSRGRCTSTRPRPRSRRSIPAVAGSTCSGPPRRTGAAEHPRGRGVDEWRAGGSQDRPGASPRSRGRHFLSWDSIGRGSCFRLVAVGGGPRGSVQVGGLPPTAR
ncbi:hypothetical protein [Streptomyces nojiriensis]|uniref:hypothetical protein n=1 Tax=Streptomyces nojiriensis TaxID=66374 RepID=UPI0040631787